MSKEKISVPIAIIAAGIIIAAAVFYSGPGNTGADNDIKPTDSIVEDAFVIFEDEHIAGNPDADLIIIEYSDTECPYCKRFHETMNKIMEDEKFGKSGSVAWAYRHFPLDSLHSKARKEAEATECAAELGGNDGFWKYLNRLYEVTPSNNKLDLATLSSIAKEVDLNVNEFKECLDSGKYAKKVNDHYKSGVKEGISGTPHSILVNKEGEKFPVNGAVPYAQFKLMVEEALGTN